MKKNLILKGLLAATMLTTVSVGTAHAAGTSAGTPISNEFTLNYKANNIDQTQIDNSDDPTVFVVDRRIDLTTAGPSGDTDTTPGTTTESFEFTFVNEGNGSDDFVFEVADNGGTVTASSPTVVSYWVDVDGNGTQGGPGEETVEYTAGSAVEIDPDLTVHVNTTAEIPADASNGETGSLLFTATAVDSSGDALTSDTENTLDGEEIVLDDGQGVADGVNPDAIHTSSATFTILAPDLTATKTAAVVSTDGSGCDAFTQAADTANEFAIPGACVEYTITVSNAASTGTVTVVVLRRAKRVRLQSGRL